MVLCWYLKCLRGEWCKEYSVVFLWFFCSIALRPGLHNRSGNKHSAEKKGHKQPCFTSCFKLSHHAELGSDSPPEGNEGWEACGRHCVQHFHLENGETEAQEGDACTRLGEIETLWMSKCECVLVTWSCPTLCNPVDCNPPGSSLYEILQARILEWFAISFSRGSSWPRDPTWLSHTVGRFFTVWATGEAQV